MSTWSRLPTSGLVSVALRDSKLQEHLTIRSDNSNSWRISCSVTDEKPIDETATSFCTCFTRTCFSAFQFSITVFIHNSQEPTFMTNGTCKLSISSMAYPYAGLAFLIGNIQRRPSWLTQICTSWAWRTGALTHSYFGGGTFMQYGKGLRCYGWHTKHWKLPRVSRSQLIHQQTSRQSRQSQGLYGLMEPSWSKQFASWWASSYWFQRIIIALPPSQASPPASLYSTSNFTLRVPFLASTSTWWACSQSWWTLTPNI